MSMKTRCLIVDDEPLAIAALRLLLSRFEDVEVAGECSDAFEARAMLQKMPVDLIFLDVQMPEVSGLDFLRSLKNPPAIILITAYKQYALEAFDLDVVDYLLKPVSGERLMKALNKYHQMSTVTALNNDQEKEHAGDFITVKSDRKNLRIALKDILWVMSVKDYVQLVMPDRKILTQLSISELEGILPGGGFLRIHRSYIVNLSKITAYTSQDVEVGRMELPIGRSYRNAVIERLGQSIGP